MKAKNVLGQGILKASFLCILWMCCTVMTAAVIGKDIPTDIPSEASTEPDMAPKAPRFDKPILPIQAANDSEREAGAKHEPDVLEGSMWECKLRDEGVGYGATIETARDRAYAEAMRNLTANFDFQLADRFVVICSIDVTSDAYDDFDPDPEQETWFAICKINATIFFMEVGADSTAPLDPFSNDAGGEPSDPLESLLDFLNVRPGLSAFQNQF